MAMKYAPDVISDWLERIRTEGRNLTSWETAFIRSVTEQWEEKSWLSERQLDIVERIYSEKVP